MKFIPTFFTWTFVGAKGTEEIYENRQKQKNWFLLLEDVGGMTSPLWKPLEAILCRRKHRNMCPYVTDKPIGYGTVMLELAF